MNERPNILLITTDQQRFDALALNGDRDISTPNLDHWASDGVNFSRAYVTCPSCIAARRTILTGLHPSNPLHGLRGYQDGLEFDPPWTLPGLLGDAGYQTQLVGKLHLFPQGKRYGFDHLVLSETGSARDRSRFVGRNDYLTWLRRQGETTNPSSHGIWGNSWVGRPFQLDENLHHSSWLVEEAIEFLEHRRDPSCPFFMHLSFVAPHPPLVPPRDYWDRYADKPYRPHVGSWTPLFDGPRRGLIPDSGVGPFDPAEMQRAQAGYHGLVNHVDDRLSHLFQQVYQHGAADNDPRPLWILFTSDHGEMLGDHELFRKALPYEGSAHVPFFIHARNMPRPAAAGRPSDALVSLEDLLPTICDMAGVATPAGVDGRSLMPILTGQADRVRDEVFGEHSGKNRANHFLVRDRLKYIWLAESNEEQLFDLDKDPWELTDISDRRELLEPMRRAMADHLAGRTDCRYDLSALEPLANRPPTPFFGAR
ncbi:MAG: Arylsulfatase [Phycisphaerae bacterium]|nr:Arylsulfatase [Phycisphaerae bacterium]